jgi:hypothetical protein
MEVGCTEGVLMAVLKLFVAIFSPFYLTCIPWTQIDSGIWYFPRPTGQNTLENLMPMAAEECSMDRKTNHSVHKTTIKTLRKAGVARNKIKHVYRTQKYDLYRWSRKIPNARINLSPWNTR